MIHKAEGTAPTRQGWRIAVELYAPWGRSWGLMAYTQEDLELIDRHIALGERNVRQQWQIVTGLRESGYATGEALQLLASLEDAVHQLHQRRTRIRLTLIAHPRPAAAPAALRLTPAQNFRP